ncbi:hypothetical protein DM02DRAFT_608098 [Periconia macrospinosa]|uniref:Uncharacterized protein n=1 Tax=Periconia macrospinosa TaxID=97972 RepID=A0A2V1EGQ7_9PLEO|nr:hypothetical protein DM02DRAFT_608098 [Periconia macrospinosa]
MPENTPNDSESEALLIRNAKAECRQLATMMLKRLPRELREMVYEYIYIEEKPILIGSNHFIPLTFFSSSEGKDMVRSLEPSGGDLARALHTGIGDGAIIFDHSIVPPDDCLLPTDYALDPSYMGIDIAHEASKLYYASNTFSLCTTRNSIQDFLFCDPGLNFPRSDDEGTIRAVGILPIDYVRNLQIRVKYEHFDIDRHYYLWGPFEREQDLLMGIFKDLEALTRPGFSASLPERKIEVIIMTAFPPWPIEPVPAADTHRRLINILEAIRNPIYTLQHDQDARISVLHHDEGRYIFPRSLTNLFALTKLDWEYEKRYLERSKTIYSPLHYLVAPAKEGAVENGFPQSKLNGLLKRRWACDPDLRPNPEFEVSRSVYWPRGRSSKQSRQDMRLSFSTDESS